VRALGTTKSTETKGIAMDASTAHLETKDVVDREFVEDFARRWLAAWNTHDVEAIVALCAEDVTLDDPALPETFSGREGARRFAAATFHTFPDVEIGELESLYVSDVKPKALAPYRFRATMLGDWVPGNVAATGARIDFTGIDAWQFRGELLSRYETMYDLYEVGVQMGLVPPRGSTADRMLTRLQHLIARFQRRRAGRPS
jgi:steroid delta-isomerase-like uncharacterized protein